MIVCTSCKHEEYYGTLYCSECGVELAYLDLELPKTVVYGNTPKPKSSPFTVPEPIYKPPPSRFQIRGSPLKFWILGQLFLWKVVWS